MPVTPPCHPLGSRLHLLRTLRVDVDSALCLSEWWRLAWPLVAHGFSGAPSLLPEAQYAAVCGAEAQAALRTLSRKVRLHSLLDAVTAG